MKPIFRLPGIAPLLLLLSLSSLDMHGLGLRGPLPPSFSSLQALQRLDLSGNQLTVRQPLRQPRLPVGQGLRLSAMQQSRLTMPCATKAALMIMALLNTIPCTPPPPPGSPSQLLGCAPRPHDNVT